MVVPCFIAKGIQTQIDVKKILVILPFMMCLLICLLLIWIMIFLPGSSDYLPNITYKDQNEKDRIDGIITGSYQHQVGYYTSSNEINTTSNGAPLNVSMIPA